MRKHSLMMWILCAAGLLPVSAFEFKIHFNPEPFVLSSDADTLAIHTNAAFYAVDYVRLFIGDTMNLYRPVSPDPDGSDKLVVFCTKAELKKAAGGFDSLCTGIRLRVRIDCDGVLDSACRVFRVCK